jgi:F-type H+-transporting ATPase subunit epsilon
MRLMILNGNNVEYKGEAEIVVMPGMDGEFSVMDFHKPFVYRLRKGAVKFEARGGQKKMLRITDGVSRFYGNSLVIICDK